MNRREKVENHLINIGNIIGTDYKPYLRFLKKDSVAMLVRWKNELKGTILLHRREDAYHAAEEKFYGETSGRSTRAW